MSWLAFLGFHPPPELPAETRAPVMQQTRVAESKRHEAAEIVAAAPPNAARMALASHGHRHSARIVKRLMRGGAK